MKTLLILRHAQALSTEVGGSDKTRKLSPQGKEDARALGKVMRQRGFAPDLVLCSPATRTKQTLECVVENLGEVETRYPESFYNAPPEAYLAGIHDIFDDHVKTLMVVGHNPGIHSLAARLAADDSSGLMDRLITSYAPATMTVLECNATGWADVRLHQNRLVDVLETVDYNAPERPTRWM